MRYSDIAVFLITAYYCREFLDLPISTVVRCGLRTVEVGRM